MKHTNQSDENVYKKVPRHYMYTFLEPLLTTADLKQQLQWLASPCARRLLADTPLS